MTNDSKHAASRKSSCNRAGDQCAAAGAGPGRVAHIAESKERERAQGAWVQRLRRELAYRRFLARLFGAQPDAWVLKGGVALLFRLDPNRPSYDIDIAHVDDGADHAAALGRLDAAIRSDLGDMFFFDLGVPRSMTDEPGASTVPVIARIGAKEFARFSVDMPNPRGGVPNEPFDLPPTEIGFDVIDRVPTLRLLPLEDQLADKVCAMFERHGADGLQFSTRSRDLADIAMICSQQRIDGSRLTASLAAEADRRAAARLPTGLPAAFGLPSGQQQQWRQTWTKSARQPPIGFDEALSLVTAFVGPVLASGVHGLHWRPDKQAWTAGP